MTGYTREFTIKAMDFSSAGEASIGIKNILKNIGVEPNLIRRVAIAAYEAEINAVVHGGGGLMRLDIDETGLVIVVEDQGPGIPDVELAMQEGYSTASPEIREMGFGAGMGLPNIQKNADSLDIRTEVGRGTRLTIVFRSIW